MKTSYLTRRVIRAIINNRPYTTAGCKHFSPRVHRSPLVPLQPCRQQTRSIFGLNLGSKGFQDAKPTTENIERALGNLVDVVRARRSHLRFPPDDQTVDSLRFLFASRLENPRLLTSNEVHIITEAFDHLHERGRILSDDSYNTLQEEDLNNILLALATSTGKDRFRSDARSLATTIFNLLRTRVDDVQTLSLSSSPNQHPAHGSLLVTYITVLSKTGSAQEALQLLRKSTEASDGLSLPMWTAVLRGLAAEGRMDEFWEVMQEVQDLVGPLDAISHEVLVTFFAQHDQISTLKRVFELPLQEGQVPTTSSIVKTVDCCIKNDEIKWASPLVKSLYERTDARDIAGTLLLWYAVHDPNYGHIRRRLEEIIDSDVPDALSINTLNRIIEYAYSQHNPGKAEEYMNLAKHLGLTLDARTRSLELDYALHQGDRSGAAKAFESLCREDIPLDRCDVPVLNRYIADLCFSADHEYNHLIKVVDHVIETNADLTAEAIAGLCHVFVRKGELEEVANLLRHRVDSLPSDDRARIAAVFRTYIVESDVKAQDAFNAYELFRHAFPETRVADRLPLMQSFFDRSRPDLACLVFGHMRQRHEPDVRPTAEAYAQCFAGIANCKDIDGLQMVYNMLKLDLEVDQTTRIHNSLMAAYVECQQPFVAIIDHFWKVMESKEGPTLSSFQLALRACEKWIPQGGHEARQIMALMQSFNLRITKEVYDLYIGALAGQSEFENVVDLIDHMLQDIGEHPDAFTIGTFYNAIPWQYRKDEVAKWAKEAYPEEWAELESWGDEIDEEWEIRYFKMNRNRDIDMNDELLFDKGEYTPYIAKEWQEALERPKDG
ncbi:hypothetical protein B0A52_05951 [Exophiala mesophila]|uniref:Pentacotripeptide-repeat region of PRORP domain-containing protein n=1 Tax=Exophiala mesophila TaxID=212818 RepID=A0A438N3W9_EXOME|nr:hypothetical protein B0A52_05951 [Exophiala mesophila]